MKEFDCHGKHMITVKIGNFVHVMDYSDQQLIYGRNYQNRWKKKVDFNKFDYVNGCRKERVSQKKDFIGNYKAKEERLWIICLK